MSSTSDLADLQAQRDETAAKLATLDHAIASLEALKTSHMIDASCPHCEYVATQGNGMKVHLMDVHPNPLIYPDAATT
jgi:hypothetical protein